MKTQKLAIPAIVAALMASLAPVPAESTTIPVTAVEHKSNDGMVSTLTYRPESEQIFLPLYEATTYLSGLNDHKRRLLNEAIELRSAKGKGLLFSSPQTMVKLAEENIAHCIRIKDAIRIILSSELDEHFPEPKAREKFRSELILFGRAVATSEYLAQDVISCIEQSRAPKKSYQPENQPSADEVRAMITSEHKSFGLSIPGQA